MIERQHFEMQRVIVFSNDAQEIDLDFGELGLGNTHDLRRCNDKSAHLEVVRGKGFLVARGLLPVLEGERAIQPKVVLSRLKHPRNQRAAPIRYSLHAIAKSDLMLDARASATGLTVGSELLFSAVLTEYGLHLDRPAGSVIVELTHPDGGKQTIALEQVKDSPGRFHGSHRTYRTGVYTAHFIVTGASYLHKRPFRRECVRTVAVFAPKECCLSEAPNLADITAT